MRAVLLLATVALVAVSLVAADYRIHASAHAKRWSNTNRLEMSLKNRGITIDPKTFPTPMWYSQTLDHFDATNKYGNPLLLLVALVVSHGLTLCGGGGRGVVVVRVGSSSIS